MLSFLYGLTLTTMHDFCKSYIFDYMDICWQSNGSAFEYTVSVGHNFSSKEQAYFNFMAAFTIHSDFGAQENQICYRFHFFSPSICHEVMGLDATILVLER